MGFRNDFSKTILPPNDVIMGLRTSKENGRISIVAFPVIFRFAKSGNWALEVDLTQSVFVCLKPTATIGWNIIAEQFKFFLSIDSVQLFGEKIMFSFYIKINFHNFSRFVSTASSLIAQVD